MQLREDFHKLNYFYSQISLKMDTIVLDGLLPKADMAVRSMGLDRISIVLCNRLILYDVEATKANG